jgi:type VI secretion system secreted protein VgrG
MRHVELSLGSGEDLDVRSYNVEESMSAAFHVELVARSHDDALDLGAVAGKAATFTFHGDEGDRVWTGVCARAALAAVAREGLSTYGFSIVPSLWLLTQRTGHRLFQHLSVPGIVTKILGEHGVEPTLRLSETYPKLALRTQYGESDYDFVRRLLAEAGISFFFDDGSKLVLSDAPSKAEAVAGSPVRFLADASLARGLPYVTDVDVSSRVAPSRATVRDHDFRRPRFALTGTDAAAGAPDALLEDYRYAPGLSLAATSGGATEPAADARGTYRHEDERVFVRARLQLEAERASRTQVTFATSRIDLAPGSVFSIDGHPHPAALPSERLLVTHAWINGDVVGGPHAGGRAVPASRPYRPVLDPGRHPGPTSSCGPFEPVTHSTKPRIPGVQSAIVTGPPGQEVHTDEHGRVTVHFPWDREGTLDEKSSPFLRVSQAWAGPAHGVHTVPRVGHEVLVAFHAGDPDHPVVVGRVHNAAAPAPYALPENKLVTSIVTSTAVGPNEITFDDTPGKQLFYMQAAGDLHKIVKTDELESTKGSRHIHVEGDLTISASGRVSFHAGKDVIAKGGPHVKVNPSETPKPAKKPEPLSRKNPPADAGGLNAILGDMKTGASFTGQSDAAAAEYKSYAERFKADAIRLGKQWHVPPAVILALMNRETRFGTLLLPDGWAPTGGAFGIMQAQGVASPGGGDGLQTMEEGMSIFHQKQQEIAAAHPGWTPAQKLAGSIAAYNSGAGNVGTQPTNPSTWAQMDQGTHANYPGSGGDYSRDVWNMAQWYAKNLSW